MPFRPHGCCGLLTGADRLHSIFRMLRGDARKRAVRIVLRALAAIALLCFGAQFSVHCGEMAKVVGLPWAWLIFWWPWVAVAVFVALGVWLPRKYPKLAAWGVAFAAGVLLINLPPLLLAAGTHTIPLRRGLDPDEQVVLRAELHGRMLHYHQQWKGHRLLVRNSDYTPALLRRLGTNGFNVLGDERQGL